MYLNEGLGQPARAKQATSRYAASTKSVEAWIESRTSISASSKVSRIALLKSYKAYCDLEGIKPVSGSAFWAKLPVHGFSKDTAKHSRTRQVMWSGRKLTAEHSHQPM